MIKKFILYLVLVVFVANSALQVAQAEKVDQLHLLYTLKEPIAIDYVFPFGEDVLVSISKAGVIKALNLSNGNIDTNLIPGKDVHVFSATQLRDGNILITGLSDAKAQQHFSNVYKTIENKIVETGAMSGKRIAYSATLLNDGNVIFIGGEKYTLSKTENPVDRFLKIIEVFNSKTYKYELSKDELIFPYTSHRAFELKDGRILIIGGFTDLKGVGFTEIYDRKHHTVKNVKSSLSLDASTLEVFQLDKNHLLISPEGCKVKIYNLVNFKPEIIPRQMCQNPKVHQEQMIKINKDELLILNGFDLFPKKTNFISVYSISKKKFYSVEPSLPITRYQRKVVFAGGEIYSIEANTVYQLILKDRK